MLSANADANAKCRRVSVCNALDCLLIHESRLNDLPALCKGLAEKQTKIYADAKAYEALKGHYPDTLLYKAEESEAKMKEADANMKSIWNTEWLSMQMGIKTVASEDEALEHLFVIHLYLPVIPAARSDLRCTPAGTPYQ